MNIKVFAVLAALFFLFGCASLPQGSSGIQITALDISIDEPTGYGEYTPVSSLYVHDTFWIYTAFRGIDIEQDKSGRIVSISWYIQITRNGAVVSETIDHYHGYILDNADLEHLWLWYGPYKIPEGVERGEYEIAITYTDHISHTSDTSSINILIDTARRCSAQGIQDNPPIAVRDVVHTLYTSNLCMYTKETTKHTTVPISLHADMRMGRRLRYTDFNYNNSYKLSCIYIAYIDLQACDYHIALLNREYPLGGNRFGFRVTLPTEYCFKETKVQECQEDERG